MTLTVRILGHELLALSLTGALLTHDDPDPDDDPDADAELDISHHPDGHTTAVRLTRHGVDTVAHLDAGD